MAISRTLWFIVNFNSGTVAQCDRQKAVNCQEKKKKKNIYELKNGENAYKVVS